MRRIFHRMFGGVGIFFRRLFGLGIPLWFVLLMVLGSLFATRIITRNQVVQEVGGKEDYDEAMRYIEIKDIIDEKYIEPVDRKSMGYSAAIAMVSGLGDAWSSFLTDDEYKTYQLSSSNEYADIGMSLVKDSSGGFQVVTVYPDSPAARSGVVIGMLIITFYLQADELISIAIFAEAFFGSIQNIINVLGDIVTVAIEEQKHLKQPA